MKKRNDWSVANGYLHFGARYPTRVAKSDDAEALAVLCDYCRDGEVPVEEAWAAAKRLGVMPVFKTAFQAMAGETLVSLKVHDGAYKLTIITSGGEYVFEAEGDCCANAFIAEHPTDKDVQECAGDVIERWDIGEVTQEDFPNGNVTDTQFYTLHTRGGMLQLTLRTEHNGYYNGYFITRSCPHETWNYRP